MTHTFRPRKGEGQGGSRRGRRSRSDGLPKTDQQSDLDLLPEIDYQKFDQMTPTELAKAAKAAKVSMDQPRSAVIEQLLAEANAEFGAIYARGILEIMNDGWGFLRRENYVPSPNDVYVSQS